MLNNQSNVVLPNWLLEKEITLSKQDFLFQVIKYLKKYDGYRLIEISNGLAVCERAEGGTVLGAKENKKSRNQRRIS